MPEIAVRGYRCDDEPDLLATWNAALPYDPIDRATLQRKVLLDPNFDPDWLLIAEAEEKTIGFCLCLIRRVPMDDLDMQPRRGWITAMGVRPGWRRRGAGSALLERAMQLFQEAGRSEVLIAPYTPNYFVPGVDEERYADGLEFLQARGFEVVSRPVSMDASIVLFDYDEWKPREDRLRDRGIEVRALRMQEIPAFTGFLKAHMPTDWLRHARELLLDAIRGLASEEQFVVALMDGEIVGYCQFDGAHFGPFGVRDDMQGQGVGTVLLAKCLQAMRAHGLHNAWVLWTSDDVADNVYARFGFRRTRRFSILRRAL